MKQQIILTESNDLDDEYFKTQQQTFNTTEIEDKKRERQIFYFNNYFKSVNMHVCARVQNMDKINKLFIQNPLEFFKAINCLQEFLYEKFKLKIQI